MLSTNEKSEQQGKIALDELDGSISEIGGDQEKVVSKNWCVKYTKNDCAFVDCVIMTFLTVKYL